MSGSIGSRWDTYVQCLQFSPFAHLYRTFFVQGLVACPIVVSGDVHYGDDYNNTEGYWYDITSNYM